MIRNILCVVVGILAGRTAIWLLGIAILHFYPTPEGLDLQNVEAFRAFVESSPPGRLFAVLGSWAVGALMGGAIATLLAERQRIGPAVAVGGLQTLLAAAQFAMIPHPTWFVVLGLSLFLPLAALAGHLVGGGGGEA